MRAKQRLLITGASGFLGWNLCRAATAAGWSVIGVVNRHRIALPGGAESARMDLTDWDGMKELLDFARPSAVIHAAALADPNSCAKEPDASRKINLEASINLAGLCADAALPLAFVSTDLVFDGRGGAPYAESATPNPVCLYGEHKMLAENGMRERWPAITICRMPLMFGEPGPAARSFIQPMLAALREGREVRLFTDEFRTPVSGRDAAVGLLLALEENYKLRIPDEQFDIRKSGIKNPSLLLHLGGRERLSRFEMGQLLARVAGLPESLLVKSRQADVTMPAVRPPDVSLDSRRAYALGYAPATFEAELRALLAG
jgi:dTDP-4-dehydrorhamnose reductase